MALLRGQKEQENAKEAELDQALETELREARSIRVIWAKRPNSSIILSRILLHSRSKDRVAEMFFLICLKLQLACNARVGFVRYELWCSLSRVCVVELRVETRDKAATFWGDAPSIGA